MAKKMTRAQVTALIEQTLKQQAARGEVSCRLIESYLTIRKWSRKGKAARAEAPPPPEAAVSLPELIEQAREASPPPTTPSGPPPSQPPVPTTTRPAGPPRTPAASPSPRPVPPPGVGALDILLGITPESPELQPSQPPPPPPAVLPSPSPAPPLPRSVYPVSHLDIADRPVIVERPTPETAGDNTYW